MTKDDLREAAIESRWEAAPAVLVVIALQVLLAVMSRLQGWSLWNISWWSWLVLVVPELGLLVALSWSRSRRLLEQLGHRRTSAVSLMALISAGNALALVALTGSILAGHETSARELLAKGLAIWTTNAIAFGLWFWELDRGGPVRRREPRPPAPDFQFPQMENPKLAEPGWHPRLIDYLYVSFTNSIAFSPTDAMPLRRRAKLLMMAEATASSVTVLLVAARAVNILH